MITCENFIEKTGILKSIDKIAGTGYSSQIENVRVIVTTANGFVKDQLIKKSDWTGKREKIRFPEIYYDDVREDIDWDSVPKGIFIVVVSKDGLYLDSGSFEKYVATDEDWSKKRGSIYLKPYMINLSPDVVYEETKCDFKFFKETGREVEVYDKDFHKHESEDDE